MKLKKGANCAVCGAFMDKSTEVVASKPKKGPTVYAHRACLKLRKEREHGRT